MSYTVRVQLHSDNYSDFLTLHRQMELRGFSRDITSDLGVKYHLPMAEYNISNVHSRGDVLVLAEEVVKAMGKTGEILVTESAGRTWSGLREVK